MSITSFLGLNIPDKNSKGRVVTDVFEPNFTKIDQNAEKLKTDIDKKLDKGNYVGTAENLHADDNAIWGGEYGGYIQDTSVVKVVGKRYIDQFDKKAYICRVAGSHVNTTAHYEECNVVKSYEELNGVEKETIEKFGFTFEILKVGKFVSINIVSSTSTDGQIGGFLLEEKFRPLNTVNFSATAAGNLRKYVEGALDNQGNFSVTSSGGLFSFCNVFYVTK